MSRKNKHSTQMSLNERFTEIASKRKMESAKESTAVNRNLLKQLNRRDKLRAALKLKRRSLRTAGGAGRFTRANLRANNGIALARGTVKALRVGANGRPIKTNSFSRVATMKADLVSVTNRSKMLRRSNSFANISKRLGGSLQSVDQSLPRRQFRSGSVVRVRSRSRSRMRIPRAVYKAPRVRSRSRSRPRVANVFNMQRGRGRSRSRSRARATPIQARLGVRPGMNATAGAMNRRGGRPVFNRRQPSLSRRGVAQGRVQRRRFSVSRTRTEANGVTGTGGGRVGRTRGRVAQGVARGRSQSRNGRFVRGQRQQQQNWSAHPNGEQAFARRGRSRQRGGMPQRNGKQVNGNQHQQSEQQQRRGRSRSRGRGGRIGRNSGQNKNQTVNKEDLDKELDQYMLTTKTENNVDFLLKN